MKFLEKLTKKTKTFQRTVGLSLQQFNTLTKRLENNWLIAEEQRKDHKNRKRKIGAGHPYKFESMNEKLLVILLYYKLYLTQEFLGMIVDIDQANISRLLAKMLPLIEKTADPELMTYLKDVQKLQSSSARINNLTDFFAAFPDLKDVSIDATEQPCYRSED